MSSPSLKYAYFPGCVAQGAGRELYLSTQAIAKAMGIELVELKKAACCGSGTFKETSQLLEDTVNARNIALAEELKLPAAHPLQYLSGRDWTRRRSPQGCQTKPARLFQ
jgi:succinate dehydrogenase / fumarate reductase, cytochrome b subunit